MEAARPTDPKKQRYEEDDDDAPLVLRDLSVLEDSSN